MEKKTPLDGWGIISSYIEEMSRKYREHLKQGKMRRGNFGNRRIELPENLLKELEHVNKEGKERGWSRVSISTQIQDAIIEYLSAIKDNGCLDPEEDELEPDDLIRDFLQCRKEHVDLVDTTRNEIRNYLKKKHPAKLCHLSDKRLDDKISAACKELQIKKRKGRPQKKPIL